MPLKILPQRNGKTVQNIVEKSSQLNKFTLQKNNLFLHAMTGCDTTSTFCGKGKMKIIKMLQKRTDLYNCTEISQQENCLRDVVVNAGTHFLLAK